METREFTLGMRQQREWRWLVIVALFLTGIEAGLFFLALIPGFVLEMVRGITLIWAGSVSLMANLSRHWDAWLLFIRHQNPWMGRGALLELYGGGAKCVIPMW